MLLVVAWDGACFDLIQPFLAAGDLPVLSKFIAEGASRELRSTIPPVTFPAWTTFMTASSPDRHGITDFTVRKRGSYSLRFVNASDRRQPTIWALMNAADLRVGVYGFPATYPPEGLDGFQICGFDTPLGSGAASRATHPAHLAGELIDRFGGLGTGGPSQARIDSGWHRRALESMSSEIELRTDIALELLGRSEVDVFAVHYGESDTVSHQFWHFFDDASPRHRDDGPAGAVARVYREMDRALGRLLEAVGEGADVVLLSDHGSGGSSNRVVFWN
ncbi:MAG: alkaline phosphatase family protein, partial [Candidatus Binatia bacterium]